MSARKNFQSVFWLFIPGVAGFLFFFIFYPKIDDFCNISPKLSKEEVRQKIIDFAETYNLSLDGYKSTFEFRRSDEIIREAQKKHGLRKTVELMKKDLPAYYWHVVYSMESRNRPEPRERNIVVGKGSQEPRFRGRMGRSITFDFSPDGRLLNFEKLIPRDSSRTDSVNAISQTSAEKYLVELTGQNPDSWVFTAQKSRRRMKQFRWVDRQVDWTDSLTAELDFVGSDLRRFRLSAAVVEDTHNGLSIGEMFEISAVFYVLIITIFVLISFIKRLRKDKIDFRNSWIMAALAAVAMTCIIVPSEIGDSILNVVLAVVFASPFLGICAFVLVSVAESYSRDIWNEQLFGYDRLLKGRIHSHKLGLNLTAGFLNSGIILGVLAGIILILSNSGFAYFSYESDDVFNFVSKFPFFKNIGSDLLISIFVFFSFFSFVASFFRRLIKNDLLFIFVVSLLFALIPLKIVPADPFFLRIGLNFFTALVLSWTLIRFDLLSSSVALFTVFTFISAMPYLNSGSSNYFLFGLLTILPSVSLLGVGLISLFSEEVREDEKEFVPDYVRRNRERERFQRELEIARSVQQRFLPQALPEVTWLDVATNCTPAYEVGGDYYDFLQLDDNRFGVVVGDVSGKGVSAAFYMTLMKGIIKSQTRNIKSPREVLIQVNDLFYENAQRGVFISMIYGVFERKDHTFTFSRAGHNPLISLFRQKGHAEEISPKGIAIGLDKGLVFNRVLKESTIKITAGDVFVFYTDGYTEAMDQNQNEFGEGRLIELVNKNSDLNANEILKKIQNEIARFTGETQQHDDMTMVVVKVCE